MGFELLDQTFAQRLVVFEKIGTVDACRHGDDFLEELDKLFNRQAREVAASNFRIVNILGKVGMGSEKGDFVKLCEALVEPRHSSAYCKTTEFAAVDVNIRHANGIDGWNLGRKEMVQQTMSDSVAASKVGDIAGGSREVCQTLKRDLQKVDNFANRLVRVCQPGCFGAFGMRGEIVVRLRTET